MFQLLNGLLFLLLQDPTAAVDAAKAVETPVVDAVAGECCLCSDTAASAVELNDENEQKPRRSTSIVDDAKARSDAAFDAATNQRRSDERQQQGRRD